MLVCYARGFTIDELGDALHNNGYLKVVFGLQPLEFSRKFAVVFQDKRALEKLFAERLTIKGPHVTFWYHK